MPRPSRPLPGQAQKSGHSIDLGAILMDIYGGLDANPLAGTDPSALPPDVQGNAGPAVSTKAFNATQQPYFKPRTIFDRQRAAMANTEKTYGELQNQQEIENKIKEATQMGPVAARNQGLMNREQETSQGNIANQGLLTQQGQQVNPQNLQTYAENTPNQQLATKNSFLDRLANVSNQLNRTLMQTDADTLNRQAMIDEAQAKQQIATQTAQGHLQQLPRELRDRLAGLDVAPLLKAAEAERAQNMLVPEGTTVFKGGRGIFRAPTKNELNSQIDFSQIGKPRTPGLLNNTTNSGIIPSGTSPMGQPVGDIQHPDQDTVIINGTVYKRNSNPAATFNPAAKF